MDIKVRNAIISVSDKTGIVEFAKELHELGIRIYSTGGTAKTLAGAGIQVTSIAEYTGFPEILDGRVKSLHPKIHGGILARRDSEEQKKQLSENAIVPFDMVVINLYPFEKTIKREGATISEAVENIDIGGPSMLRSAAKNYQFVCVVPDPSSYEEVLQELRAKGGVSLETRMRLAAEVFNITSYYDNLISSYLYTMVTDKSREPFPESIRFYFKKRQDLRYGENSHQRAAFYTNPDIEVTGVATARKLHGKELSYNNILDIESAFEIVKEFDECACSIIKHTNPCGAALASTLKQAYLDALEGDPVSAFGGIIGFNRTLDEETAEHIVKEGFTECIIAPGYKEEALKIVMKKKNLRLLETGPLTRSEVYDCDMKRVVGGVLIQERDKSAVKEEDLKIVTECKVEATLFPSLLFAWKIAKHVKSNAIVLAQGTKTVGIGAGQMSRVDAAFVAISKAKERADGAVLASDAFFPKPDAIHLVAEAGISAIIQPGGSIQDEEVIKACNDAGIAMIFTGMRHFKH